MNILSPVTINKKSLRLEGLKIHKTINTCEKHFEIIKFTVPNNKSALSNSRANDMMSDCITGFIIHTKYEY